MKSALIPLVLLAACATPAMPPEPTGPCRVGGTAERRFVGTEFRMEMRGEMQALTNSRTARVLRPGDAATMDFREDRLNIQVDENGRVSGLRCG